MRFPILRLGIKGHRDDAFRTIIATLILHNWFAETELSSEEENELQLLTDAYRRLTAVDDEAAVGEDDAVVPERERMAQFLWQIREQVLDVEYL